MFVKIDFKINVCKEIKVGIFINLPFVYLFKPSTLNITVLSVTVSC